MARLSIIAALASIASIAAADFQIYGMVDFGPVGGDQVRGNRQVTPSSPAIF